MLELQGKFYFVTVEQILDELGLEVTKIQGHNLMLCCPIHGERNPSFGIHAEDGIYNCFSCGARGNIIDLICHVRSISIEDAKRFLTGLHTNSRAIPKLTTKETPKKIDAPKGDYINRAKDYLQTRGIPGYIVDLFRIYSEGNNVVFPIYNIKGKLTGYQKRGLTKKKFLFAPGFDKNLNVYGIDILRELGDPKKPLYITESIIDCLTIWSFGGQAVSIFSAHMTDTHVKLLSQTPYRIIADGLDRDLAGRLGWERAENLLIQKGFRTVALKDHGKKDINELTKSEFEKWGI